jgi:hypothetical protein
VSNYKGPATLTVAGHTYTGRVVLRTTHSGGRVGWQGTFTPDGGASVRAGDGRIEFDGRGGAVLVSKWTFRSGGEGTAVVLGLGESPL